MLGFGLQVILRVLLNNFESCIVGITDGRNLRNVPMM
jgi:hypothetical protein